MHCQGSSSSVNDVTKINNVLAHTTMHSGSEMDVEFLIVSVTTEMELHI